MADNLATGYFKRCDMKRSLESLLTHNLSLSFPGALLPVPQWGGEEGATYVQCPEEEGSTGEGHSETAAPQSSEQHLWACTFPVLHLLFTTANVERAGRVVVVWSCFEAKDRAHILSKSQSLFQLLYWKMICCPSSVHLLHGYLANLDPVLAKKPRGEAEIKISMSAMLLKRSLITSWICRHAN